MKRSGRVFKILISIFLVYHLAAVIVLPNGSSIVGRRLGWIFLPYASTLLFNRTWQFFSPGPVKPFYLEYEIVTDRDQYLEGTGSFETNPEQYPEVVNNLRIDDFYLRMLAGMQYVAMQPRNFERYFVPFLCRRHPGAVGLDIQSVIEEIPAIDNARPDQTFSEMSKRMDLPSRVYDCQPNIDGDAT